MSFPGVCCSTGPNPNSHNILQDGQGSTHEHQEQKIHGHVLYQIAIIAILPPIQGIRIAQCKLILTIWLVQQCFSNIEENDNLFSLYWFLLSVLTIHLCMMVQRNKFTLSRMMNLLPKVFPKLSVKLARLTSGYIIEHL